MLSLTLIAAAALAGCADDGPDTVRVTQAEACKAVREKLDVEELEARFGAPDSTQDFFGDRILVYERPDAKWQFQVSAEAGTFRALRVEGSRERILSCPS